MYLSLSEHMYMEPTACSIARTYSDSVYHDPWEKVEDYQRVQAYADEHPNGGRTTIENSLELPPERVRRWLNSKQPDSVKGIETASTYGWIDPDDDMAGALVELLAHVLAGGSINETYVPAISTGQQVNHDAIVGTFEAVGVDAQIRHADSNRRATEVYPTTDASVLGRCLVAMGAPRGFGTNLNGVPLVVWESPEPVRRTFVKWYVAHHAGHSEKNVMIRIQEERPTQYLADLHKLISEFVSGPISPGEQGLAIPADATRELDLA